MKYLCSVNPNIICWSLMIGNGLWLGKAIEKSKGVQHDSLSTWVICFFMECRRVRNKTWFQGFWNTNSTLLFTKLLLLPAFHRSFSMQCYKKTSLPSFMILLEKDFFHIASTKYTILLKKKPILGGDKRATTPKKGAFRRIYPAQKSCNYSSFFQCLRLSFENDW